MRNECRTCKCERKEGVEWYDDDYCSGKCKALDGGSVPPAAVVDRNSGIVATLEDYMLDYPIGLGEKDKRGQRIKGRVPRRYRRRFEANRLNWDAPMSAPDLKQAGFRANRKPIPGDFDYVEEVDNG